MTSRPLQLESQLCQETAFLAQTSPGWSHFQVGKFCLMNAYRALIERVFSLGQEQLEFPLECFSGVPRNS